MTVNIDVQYVQVNQYTRPGRKNSGIRGIVEHYTASPGATAQNIRDYFNGTCIRNKRYAGVQYAVHRKHIIQLIPDNEVAYHAHDNSRCYPDELGDNANFTTLGIEMCIEKDGSLHPETVQTVKELTAYLCKKYSLDPLKRVYRHYDVTGKNCPAMWVSNPALFTAFKAGVNDLVKGVSTSNHTDYGVHVVQSGDTLWGIAQEHNVTVDTLEKFNPGVEAKSLDIGQKIIFKELAKPVSPAPKPQPKPVAKPAVKYPLPTGVYKYENRYTQSKTGTKQIQRALNACFFKCGEVDGIYGRKVEDAVKRFQSVHVGDVDGIYGNDTRHALNRKVN
jgi:N-acetylmuramoyl-L-alanine amidase